jgi:hypothetical protein
MAKKSKPIEGGDPLSGRDELASVLADNLNKKFKDMKAAYFLGDDVAPTDLTEWVSTGSLHASLGSSPRA